MTADSLNLLIGIIYYFAGNRRKTFFTHIARRKQVDYT